MAEIKDVLFLKHLRSEPTFHTIHYRKGKIARSGSGLAFWFRPLAASVVEVPLDDQELQFVFHGRSLDFQDIAVQGVITYRIKDPDVTARRIDFTISLDNGNYVKTPLEQLAGLLSQLSQQFVLDYLAKTELTKVFSEGTRQIRDLIQTGLEAEKRLQEMGIEIVAVRVSAIKPSSEVEKALQTPTRENIQQQADEAMFARRAMAVKKERDIESNELQNKIELAKQKELLVAQQGQNDRLQAQEKEAASKIVTQGETERSTLIAQSKAKQVEITSTAEAKRQKLVADAEAHHVEIVEGARVATEKERMQIYAELDQHVMMGLAAQELAKNLKSIDHLNISPDMLTPLLANLMQAKTDEITEG